MKQYDVEFECFGKLYFHTQASNAEEAAQEVTKDIKQWIHDESPFFDFDFKITNISCNEEEVGA